MFFGKYSLRTSISSFRTKFNICAWTLLRIVHNTNRKLHGTVSRETGSAHIHPALCFDPWGPPQYRH